MAYSDKETAALQIAADENGSITFDMAVELARELCKTPRSVIAKIKQMNLPYTPKPKAEPKAKGITKAEMVDLIAKNLEVDASVLAGLTKAKAEALSELVNLT